MRLKREGQKGKRRGYRGHKSSKLPYQRCSVGKWRQSRTFSFLKWRKADLKSRYAYYAATSHSMKYGLHHDFANLVYFTILLYIIFFLNLSRINLIPEFKLSSITKIKYKSISYIQLYSLSKIIFFSFQYT